MSITQQLVRSVRPAPEKREVAFYVRAKTGPGPRDWSGIGVAFARKNNEPGFTIKLNCLPIGEWNGALVLVPPFVEEDAPIEDEPVPETISRRRRRSEEEPPV